MFDVDAHTKIKFLRGVCLVLKFSKKWSSFTPSSTNCCGLGYWTKQRQTLGKNCKSSSTWSCWQRLVDWQAILRRTLGLIELFELPQQKQAGERWDGERWITFCWKQKKTCRCGHFKVFQLALTNNKHRIQREMVEGKIHCVLHFLQYMAEVKKIKGSGYHTSKILRSKLYDETQREDAFEFYVSHSFALGKFVCIIFFCLN